jgi:hypothetical protein
MRIKLPKDGDKVTKKWFALFPTKVDGYLIWLEFYTYDRLYDDIWGWVVVNKRVIK